MDTPTSFLGYVEKNLSEMLEKEVSVSDDRHKLSNNPWPTKEEKENLKELLRNDIEYVNELIRDTKRFFKIYPTLMRLIERRHHSSAQFDMDISAHYSYLYLRFESLHHYIVSTDVFLREVYKILKKELGELGFLGSYKAFRRRYNQEARAINSFNKNVNQYLRQLESSADLANRDIASKARRRFPKKARTISAAFILIMGLGWVLVNDTLSSVRTDVPMMEEQAQILQEIEKETKVVVAENKAHHEEVKIAEKRVEHVARSNYSEEQAFEMALRVALGLEGGISNHRLDPGRLTAHGVTQKTYSSWRSRKGLEWRSVRKMTGEEMVTIYREDYWKVAKCDVLKDPALQIVHFNACINIGPYHANKCLQKALNAAGQNIKVDGGIGRQTMGALAAALEQGRHKELLEGYFKAQNERYDAILAKNKKMKVFINGWRNRVERTRRGIISLGLVIPENIKTAKLGEGI